MYRQRHRRLSCFAQPKSWPSPVTQLLPIEVATAAGRLYLGIDPAEIDEVVAFGEFSDPTQPLLGFTYGLTFKFKAPFRAVSIPEQVRPAVQLSELNGKKYLQSAHPIFPSFYGPNNKTLVAAPDAMLRRIVESSSQPKSGPLLDRLREVPAGSDLYVAVDAARLRGLVPMALGMLKVTLAGVAKDMLDSVSAAELTLNLATRGPITFVVHCNDEATAQQMELALAAAKQNFTATAPTESPAGISPFQQGMTQYLERIYQRFQPQRNGASITCLHIGAEDPLQPQLFGMVVGAIGASAGTMKSFSATNAPQPVPGNGPVATSDGGPEVTGPPASPADSAAPETERR